jgi:NADH:ubiquinone oxidoreductase subunit 6 (subunit J)
VKLIGKCLYTHYNIPFVILGFALLSGSVGAVALARKIRKD